MSTGTVDVAVNFALLGPPRDPSAGWTRSNKPSLSGWISERNREGSTPRVTRDVVERILSRPLPGVGERADRLLLEAMRGQDRLGASFNINEPRFISATYSQDPREVTFLLKMLTQRGLMQSTTFGEKCEIQPDGYIAAEALVRRTGPSDKGFRRDVVQRRT